VLAVAVTEAAALRIVSASLEVVAVAVTLALAALLTSATVVDAAVPEVVASP